MCGRYHFKLQQSDEIIGVSEKLNEKFQGREYKTGEIFPTDPALILVGEKGKITPVLSIWGFPKYDSKGVIINARVESVFEKKIFRDSVLNCRCVIPSNGFYEWDGARQKYLFRSETDNVLYMAGLYTFSKDGMRHVILTTDANESMKDIHNRMPLIIPKQEIRNWIMDNQATHELLHRVPPPLFKEAADGQLSLF
jgi:putative SOS response-associated peptidase YedK